MTSVIPWVVVRALLRSLAPRALAPRALALCSLLLATSASSAQYCAPAVFVGDLNEDNLVNTADVTVWTALSAAGQYKPCADLNRNGVLDADDKTQLQRAAKFALTTGGGLGLQGRIPAFSISELRSGQPLVSDPQQRFVEFRVPSPLPSNYNFLKKFTAGYYLVLIARNTPTGASGRIRRVIDLNGVEFSVAGAAANLALVVDSSFSLPLPLGSLVTTLPTGQSISFSGQHDLNTSWLLVYRRPSGPGFSATVAFPAVGQSVDGNQNCVIDNRYTNSSIPQPNQIPPWDIVLDCISVDRSLLVTGPGGRGCIYGHGALFEVAPVIISPGVEQAALHVYRGAGSKECSGIRQAVTTGIDTPGATNPPAVPDQFCGSPATGLCSQIHSTPFCSDQACCEYVCSRPETAYCCQTEWDANCVASAGTNCFQCGLPGTGGCLSEHTEPNCSSQECCDSVCAQLPLCCLVAWDASCVAKALELCLGCGVAVLPSCFVEGTTPYCNNAVCCNTVCLVDPPCCSLLWDSVCVSRASILCQEPSCGSPIAGDCCLSHGTPFCADAQCCDIICPLDPFCCETVWDVQCVNGVNQFCTGLSCACGGGGAGADCFAVHEIPGCVSTSCCNSVCNSDAFCCGVTWDASCVAAAEVFCAGNPVCKNALDSCAVIHAAPGCSDPACCDAVCSVNPFCCETSWDAACVESVVEVCGGCGDVFTGDCSTVHKTPYCDNAICCGMVCAADPFCCASEWDFACVERAATLCPVRKGGCGDPTARSCFVASFMQGCSDPGCCIFICDIADAYCCTVQWDAICVGQALTFAQLGLGCTMPAGSESGRGNCLVAHATKGCSDEDCAAAVCSIDENCCRIIWDADCADLAEFVCISPGGCPGTEGSFSVHTSPGSIDPSCCNAVCLVMPSCCEIGWTQPCVTLANQRCKPAPTWNLPCTGSCTEVHDNPGCDDVACGSAVCYADATCCTIMWDQECATLARGLCCGLPGCGSPCNGPCLVPHETPDCSDPFCCAAVCAEDPYCCSVEWDSFCVKFAFERCATGCGNVEAGSCFIGHNHAGCADALCCVKICRDDPFCCETGWDSACGQAAQADPDCASTLVCGDEAAGECCSAHIDSPKCRNAACCQAICALDSICCDFGWDQACVGLALSSAACDCTRPCGDACANECCTPHETPNCKDLACCTAVCAIDSYCCDTAWDISCANGAQQICNIGPDAACPPPQCGDLETGNCCVPHLSPSCRKVECCEAVCAIDPNCCITQWDSSCVEHANGLSGPCECDGPSCGSSGTGSCFTAHATPFCDQSKCCFIICGKIQPECCTISWDATCAELATFFCSGP